MGQAELELGFQVGGALARGFTEWKQIQKDRQDRRDFEGRLSLYNERARLINEAGANDEEAILKEMKGQIQRSPNAQAVQRPTGAVLEDATPETEEVIRTEEGDIPLKQFVLLLTRKDQVQADREFAQLDEIMRLQAALPENKYARQFAASAYTTLKAKQDLRLKQSESLINGLQVALTAEQRGLEREKFEQERLKYAEEPGREQAKKTFETNEDIRKDAARIEAEKRAKLETDAAAAASAKPKEATEFVKKLQQMAPRAQQALQTIEQLEQSAPDEVYDRTGLKAGLESIAPTAARSGKRQQYDQAALQFINSVLRAESGATITESEIQKARDQYFPKLGESAEVVEQKRQARRTAAQELFRAANLEQPAAGQSARPRSPEEVRAAFKAGQLNREQAREMLRTMGR